MPTTETTRPRVERTIISWTCRVGSFEYLSVFETEIDLDIGRARIDAMQTDIHLHPHVEDRPCSAREYGSRLDELLSKMEGLMEVPGLGSRQRRYMGMNSAVRLEGAGPELALLVEACALELESRNQRMEDCSQLDPRVVLARFDALLIVRQAASGKIPGHGAAISESSGQARPIPRRRI